MRVRALCICSEVTPFLWALEEDATKRGFSSFSQCLRCHNVAAEASRTVDTILRVVCYDTRQHLVQQLQVRFAASVRHVRR